MLNNHFEVFLADTPESKEIHYSIRYQVFCEEMKVRDKDDYPLRMEQDEYDKEATHFIVRSKLTGEWVGTMRLIAKKDELLPIEKHCKMTEEIDTNKIFGAVELSRLCLIKTARKGCDEKDFSYESFDNAKQAKKINKAGLIANQNRMNRKIIWILFQAAAEYGYLNKISYCYFMTSLTLAKVLKRGGLNLINIGDSCQHKIKRNPFKINAGDAYQSKKWQDTSGCYSLFSDHAKSEIFQELAVA